MKTKFDKQINKYNDLLITTPMTYLEQFKIKSYLAMLMSKRDLVLEKAKEVK